MSVFQNAFYPLDGIIKLFCHRFIFEHAIYQLRPAPLSNHPLSDYAMERHLREAPAAASSKESARLRRFSASSNFDTNLSNPPRFMTCGTIRRGLKGRQPGRNSRASCNPPLESPSPILYRKGWFSGSNGSVKDCVFGSIE